MLIICLTPLEKLDKCRLILANPKTDPVHDMLVKCKSRFKYALRFIKNNVNMLRKEALAKNPAYLNPKAAWSEKTV